LNYNNKGLFVVTTRRT